MSNWRAMADDALQGWDKRDNRDASPAQSERGGANVPSVPSVPSVLAPLDSLKHWQKSLLALDPCDPRPGFSIGRWQTLYDAAVWFVESFGRQVALDGWPTGDLFGIHPHGPRYGGLIDRLGHQRGLVLADGEARWRYLGEVPQRYIRGWQPDLKAFWEIDLG